VVEEDWVLDTEVDAVPVLDEVVVFVLVTEPVLVFVINPLDVVRGEDEDDLDDDDVLVDVMLTVVVLVVVVDGLGAIVAPADLLKVVVFVEVLDSVAVDDGTTPKPRATGSIL
jgi:hypothetical protein